MSDPSRERPPRGAPFLDGILPPITTPFDGADEVDVDALRRNLERYEAVDLAGYVVFGSNGEAVHLDATERAQVLRTVRSATRKTVVAGVNALSTRMAVDEAARVADLGADAALVITPYFYKGAMDHGALHAFFAEVAAAAQLPILAYDVPQNTGVVVPPETRAALADVPRIIGIKDSSGDLPRMTETLARCPDSFRVLVGNAGILVDALYAGAAGAILAVACLCPEACTAIHRACREGAFDEARALHDRLAPVGRMVTAELGVAGLKAALDLAGFSGGAPRAPLQPLTRPAHGRLRRTLAESGFFPELGA